MNNPVDDRADICVYACTGKFGSSVAHLICALADESTTLLLAGRNLAKVRALSEELLARVPRTKVRILVHPEAVHVEKQEALDTLATRVRVIVNCVKVDAQQEAAAWIAEACIKANTHYVDIAVTLSAMAPIWARQQHSDSTAKLVPACGLDYAFFDVAVSQSEQALTDMYGTSIAPKKVQLVMAIRPGPLGFKWRVDSIDSYFRSEKYAKQLDERTAPVPNLPPQQRAPLVSYCVPGLAWSVPWFVGRDALRFLIWQRNPNIQQVDARLALPRKLWWAVVCGIYGFFLAIISYPLLALAWHANIGWLQWLLLKTLPIVSFGFFTEDIQATAQAVREVRAELYVTITSTNPKVSNGDDLEFLFHVLAPSIYLEHECAAIAAMELAKVKGGPTGALTPAQALQDTDFWKRLQQVGHLQIHTHPKSVRKQ